MRKLDEVVRQLKIFFFLTSMLWCASPVVALQQPNEDMEWYRSIFEQDKQKPAEDLIAQSTSKLNQAIETNDFNNQAKALTEIGLLHLLRTSDYEKAMQFLTKALVLEDSLQLTHEQIFTKLAIARVFEEVGDYPKSAQVLEEALRLNEKEKNTSILVVIANALGKINAAMGHTEKALEYYELVLGYTEQLDDQKVESEVLFNLGNLYQVQGKFNEALRDHKKALAIRREDHNKKEEAISLYTIGELYWEMKNSERALANHVAALEIRQTLGDKKAIGSSYNTIGKLYFQQKNIVRAIANLELGLKAAQEAQDQEEIRKSYEYLSQCYSAKGDYKKALTYKELYAAIHDFIEHEKNERQLLEIQNQYVVTKNETQIDKLESERIQREKELTAQKQIKNFLMVIILLGVVISALGSYLYILKRKSNAALKLVNEKVQEQNITLQNLNATKDKFFSIISHDLKGPLNSLTSFSGLLINHIESLSKEEIQMLAKDLDKSLKNLFTLLENLLEWSRSQTGNIEFKPARLNLAELLEQNKELLQTQAQNKKISLVINALANLMVHAHPPSINTVVRNLLSNAIKFTPENGTITLALRQIKNEVIVSIADTGVGMPPEVLDKLFRIDAKHSTQGTANEKGTGLGLILCKEFIEKNGGRIWVESQIGNGSVFYFALPAPASTMA